MNDILSNNLEYLIVYDEKEQKEIAKITKDEVITINSDIVIKIKETEKSAS